MDALYFEALIANLLITTVSKALMVRGEKKGNHLFYKPEYCEGTNFTASYREEEKLLKE